MSPDQFKKNREKLGLTQEQLAEVIGVSGKVTISHYETGFRKPSLLTEALISLLNSLPERKANELIEQISEHIRKAKRHKKGHSNDQ